MSRASGQHDPSQGGGQALVGGPSVDPLQIHDVVIFSAEEMIRETQAVIRAAMPGVEVRILPSPMALAGARFEGPTVVLLDDTGLLLGDTEAIRRSASEICIVLLSFSDAVQCSPPDVARRELPYTAKADLVFAVNRADLAPSIIITSVIRAAEDQLDIERRSRSGRSIFLIVDDEPRWASRFLPVLYPIIGSSAAVKITRTFEQTLEFLFGVTTEAETELPGAERGLGSQVVCLITDLFFPKSGRVSSDAGRDLVRLVHQHYPGLPIIIASRSEEAAALGGAGFVLRKGDPGSLEALQRYIHDSTGIGEAAR